MYSPKAAFLIATLDGKSSPPSESTSSRKNFKNPRMWCLLVNYSSERTKTVTTVDLNGYCPWSSLAQAGCLSITRDDGEIVESVPSKVADSWLCRSFEGPPNRFKLVPQLCKRAVVLLNQRSYGNDFLDCRLSFVGIHNVKWTHLAYCVHQCFELGLCNIESCFYTRTIAIHDKHRLDQRSFSVQS